MVNGRNKGNNYENTICLVLSRWLDPRISPKAKLEQLPFRRRSTSIMPLDGHWHGSGDILHRPDLDWPFCVECKKVEGWTLDGVFLDGWPVWSWWDQTEEQAIAAGLAPLLICGRNHKPDYALLREGDARCLGLSELVRSSVSLRTPDGAPLVLLQLRDLVRVAPSRLSNVSTASRSRKRSAVSPRTTTGSNTSTCRKPRPSGRSSSR
jgi:hypothetical protein